MTIEHARAHTLPKPWGVEDLRPWSNAGHEGNAIGEIWFERPDKVAKNPSLLLKLLFTNQPLSIQVHPDDAFAQSMGQPSGKTEAWYVLRAAPEAKVALGLTQRLTPEQLRKAIDTGSISDLVLWRAVFPGDTILVPAGTIHAIGAGLVIAEIQQRSDITYRLFDQGRQRELHIERAIAVADSRAAEFQILPSRLTDQRSLLVTSAHFVLERLDLAPNFAGHMEVDRETWLLVLSGSARAGPFDVATGDTIFAQSDRVEIHAGNEGMVGLVAYTGVEPVPHLLQCFGQQGSMDARQSELAQLATRLTRAKATATNGRLRTIQ